MIIISTYNPDTKRTTQDEELLTTLLLSLIRHAIRCDAHKIQSQDETEKTYWTEQKNNCNRLIGLAYPLLGLDWYEVEDLLKAEREKWPTLVTGKT